MTHRSRTEALEARSRSSQRSGRTRRLGPLGILLVGAVLLGGCTLNPTWGATRGVTAQSHQVFNLWYWMVLAGLVVAVFVWGLIFWSVIRYRRRKGETSLPKQFQEHIPLELFYTIVPLLMVFVIFGFTVVVENYVDRVTTHPSVVIDATGYQWGWEFSYAHTGGVVIETAPHAAPSALPLDYTSPLYPQMVLPKGETVRFFLRSNDVIHGFFVRDFFFSRYAQPGVVNEFEITPTQTGVFRGQCTQYCGLYHSEMLFSVRVVTPAQYHVWLTGQQRALLTSASSGASS